MPQKKQYLFLTLIFVFISVNVFYFSYWSVNSVPLGYFRNVCFDADLPSQSSFPFQLRLKAFDKQNLERVSTIMFPLNVKKGNYESYWSVEVGNVRDQPRKWKMLDAVGYFPSYWRDTNHIFLLWHDTIPTVYAQITESKKLGIRTNNSLLVVPSLQKINKSFRDTILSLGLSKIVSFDSLLSDGPVCFTHGIFGRTKTRADEAASRNYLLNKGNLEDGIAKCNSYHVLFIERNKTRHILNIDYLVKLVKEHGYSRVRVEHFEGKSIQEQLSIIRCTSVMIAVQGAALSWYGFLPKGATFIEITWPGWPMRFKSRAKRDRPDINAQVIECTSSTPDGVWRKYAERWFKYSGPITPDLKVRLIEKSREFYPISDNVWKDSDVSCPDSTFLYALPNAKQVPS